MAIETSEELAERLRNSQSLQKENPGPRMVSEGLVFAGISTLFDLTLGGVRSIGKLAMNALPMAAIGAVFGLSSVVDANRKIDQVRREIDNLTPPER